MSYHNDNEQSKPQWKTDKEQGYTMTTNKDLHELLDEAHKALSRAMALLDKEKTEKRSRDITRELAMLWEMLNKRDIDVTRITELRYTLSYSVYSVDSKGLPESFYWSDRKLREGGIGGYWFAGPFDTIDEAELHAQEWTCK